MKLPIDFENPETVKFYDSMCIKNHVNCEEPRTIERYEIVYVDCLTNWLGSTWKQHMSHS